MNVWKVGSRWSEWGDKNASILDLFRRHNVVFVGRFQARMKMIQQGDLIAISDGLKIVAIAKAVSDGAQLETLRIGFMPEELGRFCDTDKPIPDDIVGCKAVLHDLEESQFLECRQGTIHRQNQHCSLLIDLYEQHHQRFDQRAGFNIQARTCTLLVANPDGGSAPLLERHLSYEVPIYQRPYSWGETQIQRLIEDLLRAFRRVTPSGREPMFIGTMQLSGRRLISLDKKTWSHEVIDGQQRLTTLALILKWLSLSGVHDETLTWLWDAKWLSTRVNSGEQQTYLAQALKLESLAAIPPESLNPYFHALRFIDELMKDALEGDEERLDQSAFADYLKSQVHFVVIETTASLSKTLQIFDTINTSGLDLDGSDLFKVRFYEYLCDKSGKSDGLFNQISELYQRIDAGNREAGKTVCSMAEILSLLQHDIIARCGLARGLHNMSCEAFFEGFFDSRQGLKQVEGFGKDAINKIDITIGWVEKIIAKRFRWTSRKTVFKDDPEFLVALEMISRSRYSQYRYLPILLLCEDGTNFPEVGRFTIQLAKLLTIFSLRFAKAVKECHGLVQENMKAILERKDWAMFHEACTKNAGELERVLNEDLFAYSAKGKNIVCRLSAALHQKFKDFEPIFQSGIDIEHIEPATFADGSIREEVNLLWGDERHRLGNLIILEESINRSIQNIDHASKLVEYGRSGFQATRDFAREYPEWSLEIAKARKAREIDLLSQYLCGAPA